eukprot:COSAG06_NODE_60358_length_271_cov_0.598837_1_plen_31_part_10
MAAGLAAAGLSAASAELAQSSSYVQASEHVT